jgi:hypothetical protein
LLHTPAPTRASERNLIVKRLLVLAVIALLALLTSIPGVAAAQTSQRCFPETGFCVSGPIRQYWERNGGLPVFGYPISPQRVESVEGRSLQVQWFERDRLEIQADGTLTAGRLGARVLELNGIDWQQLPGDTAVQPGCRFFRETQLNLCDPFLSYWERNGGLERFGYPLTRVRDEPIEGRVYQVQYFERRRMELHPENAAPFDLLLGLLGREVLAREGAPVALPDCAQLLTPSLRAAYTRVQLGHPLGCPTLAPSVDVPAATQAMERGHMIWYGQAAGPPMLTLDPRIFAVIAPGAGLSFKTYDDTWVAGRDPDTPGGTPPQPDLFPPWRGFGKVWNEDADLRQRIGWAREAQARPDRADVQLFDSGILLVHLREANVTWAFGNPSNPGEVQYLP